MIKPDSVLDETEKAAAQLQIQAMTVIHPDLMSVPMNSQRLPG